VAHAEPYSPELDTETESEDETDELEFDRDPSPSPKRKKLSPTPPKKRRQRRPKTSRKGPLTTLLEASAEKNKSIAIAIGNDEVDDRMDVVVKEIKRDGRSPFLSLRCTVVNAYRPFDANLLVNLDGLDKSVKVIVGGRLTICAPWQKISLTQDTMGFLCPFVRPYRA